MIGVPNLEAVAYSFDGVGTMISFQKKQPKGFVKSSLAPSFGEKLFPFAVLIDLYPEIPPKLG
jgi:hypothetical protein